MRDSFPERQVRNKSDEAEHVGSFQSRLEIINVNKDKASRYEALTLLDGARGKTPLENPLPAYRAGPDPY